MVESRGRGRRVPGVQVSRPAGFACPVSRQAALRGRATWGLVRGLTGWPLGQSRRGRAVVALLVLASPRPGSARWVTLIGGWQDREHWRRSLCAPAFWRWSSRPPRACMVPHVREEGGTGTGCGGGTPRTAILWLPCLKNLLGWTVNGARPAGSGPLPLLCLLFQTGVWGHCSPPSPPCQIPWEKADRYWVSSVTPRVASEALAAWFSPGCCSWCRPWLCYCCK